MCDWVTLLYCRKLTEHCKPTIMEKVKIIKKFLAHSTHFRKKKIKSFNKFCNCYSPRGEKKSASFSQTVYQSNLLNFCLGNILS